MSNFYMEITLRGDETPAEISRLQRFVDGCMTAEDRAALRTQAEETRETGAFVNDQRERLLIDDLEGA